MTVVLNAADLVYELHFLANTARPLLAPGHAERLGSLAHQLRLRCHDGPGVWEIPENNPIETEWTRGFQRDDEGREPISAALAATWALAPTHDRSLVRTDGNVSTVVTLCSRERELGVIRMELGAADNPGCYFHAQVERHRNADDRWPGWLDVPRLPIFVPTPGAVLEFVLGELWQDEWPTLLERSPSTTRWLKVHRRRWRAHLDWQRDVVDRATHSAWMSLKRAQPDDRVL